MSRLIDADALIEDYRDIIDCEIDHCKYQNTVREIIDSAQTIEPPKKLIASITVDTEDLVKRIKDEFEPKHGSWMYNGDGEYMCSECHKSVTWKTTRYCPHCGARMED